MSDGAGLYYDGASALLMTELHMEWCKVETGAGSHQKTGFKLFSQPAFHSSCLVPVNIRSPTHCRDVWGVQWGSAGYVLIT